MLSGIGLQCEAEDRTKLVENLGKTDISKGDVPATLKAIGTWLAAVGLDEESTKVVLAQGEQALPQLFPAAGIVAPSHEAERTNGTIEANGTTNESVKEIKRILVEDVKGWKASLPLAANPKPVKDLSEFEELESKL